MSSNNTFSKRKFQIIENVSGQNILEDNIAKNVWCKHDIFNLMKLAIKTEKVEIVKIIKNTFDPCTWNAASDENEDWLDVAIGIRNIPIFDEIFDLKKQKIHKYSLFHPKNIPFTKHAVKRFEEEYENSKVSAKKRKY